MSSPSKRMDPPAVRTRRSTALPMVVFPEPLSPTSPRPQGPAGSCRLTPSTARTGPNRTASSLMSSNGAAFIASLAGASLGRAGGAPDNAAGGTGVAGLAPGLAESRHGEAAARSDAGARPGGCGVPLPVVDSECLIDDPPP